MNMKNILTVLLLITGGALSAQILNDPTGNVSNVQSTTGLCYVIAAPTWNPDLVAASKYCKLAYNEITGDLWTWEKNKIAVNDGAWVLKGFVARTSGVPSYTPTNLNELAVDGSTGTLYSWNGSAWVTGATTTATNGVKISGGSNVVWGDDSATPGGAVLTSNRFMNQGGFDVIYNGGGRFNINTTTDFSKEVNIFGKISLTDVNSNAVVGLDAYSGTGFRNVFFGVQAGLNKIGDDNLGIGFAANNGGTGNDNIGVGRLALYQSSGSNNVAVGNFSMFGANTGFQNTGLGNISLRNNTTGYQNTGIGARALQGNTTGFANTGIGVEALVNNTTSYANSALGYTSGYRNTTGSQNSLFGSTAGQGNTTGSFNTLMGNEVCLFPIMNWGTFIGSYAGLTADGDYQIGLGAQAGSSVRGGNNVSIGRQANFQVELDATSYTITDLGGGNYQVNAVIPSSAVGDFVALYRVSDQASFGYEITAFGGATTDLKKTAFNTSPHITGNVVAQAKLLNNTITIGYNQKHKREGQITVGSTVNTEAQFVTPLNSFGKSNVNAPHAALDVVSRTYGALMPRMLRSDRDVMWNDGTQTGSLVFTYNSLMTIAASNRPTLPAADYDGDGSVDAAGKYVPDQEGMEIYVVNDGTNSGRKYILAWDNSTSSWLWQACW